MRIVMMCRLHSPHKGGVEKHVEELSKIAIQNGHKVHVVTLRHDSSLPTVESKDGIIIHRIQVSNGKTITRKIAERILLWSWMVAHLMLFIKADIIHIHDVFFWYWPIRLILPWKKVFITFHGFEAGSLPTPKAITTRQTAAKWTRGNISVGGWIEKWYKTKPTFITYGGAAIHQTNKNTKFTSKNLRLVFIGRLDHDTGIISYIDAVQNLPHMRLDVYGDGPLRSLVSSLCAEGSHCEYKGILENTDSIYSHYDIACVSTYLSMIEAMQSKTLVVAYVTDALKSDYVNSFPGKEWIYTVSAEEELVNLFNHLQKKEIDTQVNLAFKWAKQQTWESVYRLYEKLWKI